VDWVQIYRDYDHPSDFDQIQGMTRMTAQALLPTRHSYGDRSSAWFVVHDRYNPFGVTNAADAPSGVQ
jgi:hypothetical protein